MLDTPGWSLCPRLPALFAAAFAVCALGAWQPALALAGPPAIAARCRADLAKRLGVKPALVQVTKADPVTWPSPALGMPRHGAAYSAAMTPGWRIVLSERGTQYLYTASADAFRYGGPLGLWSHSLLYLRPIRNEPNLNGNLMQSSLVGTNERLVLSGVSECYPQPDGGILVTRRTSRSGFDMLYVAPGVAGSAVKLVSGFGLADGAVEAGSGEWAAFVRHGFTAIWSVALGDVRHAQGQVRYRELPSGASPIAMAWSGKALFVQLREDDKTRVYEMSPASSDAAWKPASPSSYPGASDFLLNKSESLKVRRAQGTATPAAEVVRVWFTGDEKTVARIPGLTMDGFEFFSHRYVFVWGRKGDGEAAYTVDIGTGQTVPADVTGATYYRALHRAPQSTPLRSR